MSERNRRDTSSAASRNLSPAGTGGGSVMRRRRNSALSRAVIEADRGRPGESHSDAQAMALLAQPTCAVAWQQAQASNSSAAAREPSHVSDRCRLRRRPITPMLSYLGITGGLWALRRRLAGRRNRGHDSTSRAASAKRRGDNCVEAGKIGDDAGASSTCRRPPVPSNQPSAWPCMKIG